MDTPCIFRCVAPNRHWGWVVYKGPVLIVRLGYWRIVWNLA
jgi:hypothetical protein